MFHQAQARRNYKFIYAKQCFPAQIAPTVFFFSWIQAEYGNTQHGRGILVPVTSQHVRQERKLTPSFLPHECWCIRLVPAQLCPFALIHELGFALPLVGPETHFMAPSQLTNYPQCMLSLPLPAYPKRRVPSPPGVTLEGYTISLSR